MVVYGHEKSRFLYIMLLCHLWLEISWSKVMLEERLSYLHSRKQEGKDGCFSSRSFLRSPTQHASISLAELRWLSLVAQRLGHAFS